MFCMLRAFLSFFAYFFVGWFSGQCILSLHSRYKRFIGFYAVMK